MANSIRHNDDTLSVDEHEEKETAEQKAEQGGAKNNTRRKERSLIFHLLYAVEGFEYDVSLEAIVDNFNRGFDQSMSLDDRAVVVAREVVDKRDELDEAIVPFLSNWRFERISVPTKLILRLAFWEMLYTDMAPTIVINEAIELAKCFAESDAYRFINGVLDSFIKKTRT